MKTICYNKVTNVCSSYNFIKCKVFVLMFLKKVSRKFPMDIKITKRLSKFKGSLQRRTKERRK